jgi:hypothetical protein
MEIIAMNYDWIKNEYITSEGFKTYATFLTMLDTNSKLGGKKNKLRIAWNPHILENENIIKFNRECLCYEMDYKGPAFVRMFAKYIN